MIIGMPHSDERAPHIRACARKSHPRGGLTMTAAADSIASAKRCDDASRAR
jgi:hypothetical protein